MSMISGLIDELNKSADEWNGSNMFELARMCREAADTITELRGALQVASVDYRHLQDENARLLSCLSDDAENARMIMAENEKLRELVWRLLEIERIGATSSEWHEVHETACELGIEEPSRWVTCECGEDVELFDGFHEAVCPSCGARVTEN